ncbi:glycosyltransferase [Archaeoglobus profundus]|uniref:Glycosyl transferase group 1 n=1 Tax=Archaeoglobus profundus (strain DSM 5631 / JCM 9629 / NBRC 100127 / Av18) TaxID=572546 RepID=D2RH05_ARCPA|nr:glycosyltransferase [Archaeoglobus profundus]ADB57580.1 glycosyl transferase group 1 [Archaeoglobus profundus DSM 5631]
MKIRKVAILGPSKRFLSGVSYYTIRLSNALSAYVHVRTILFRNMLPKRLFPGWKRVGENLTYLEFDKRVEVHEILDWNNPSTWLKAFNLMKDCDAVILEWWTSSVAHMYLSVELLNGIFAEIPTVIEFHEVIDPLESSILPIRIYSRVVGKVIRKLADHYVVHSEMGKKLIGRVYGISLDKISVIPHGLYDHYKRVEGAKEKLGIKENFVILFFGLLRPYKGVKYLVKAFESLPKEVLEDSRLLIVGETWEDRETTKLIANSKYRNKITVVNRYVPDNEVSLYFSASDVVVLPYTRASQSGVAHIAMAFGLPVISTYVGGLRESLSKYKGTIFVKPMNADELAEAIVKAYRNGRKRFSPPKDLSWNEIAKRWIKLLNQL